MPSQASHGQGPQTTGKNGPIPGESTSVADPSASSILSNISASASSLLSSIAGPPPASLITGSLASSSHSAFTKSSNQRNHSSNIYASAEALSTDQSPSLRSASTITGTTGGVDGFRSRQSGQSPSVEDEFASFERQPFPELYEIQQTPPDPKIDGYKNGLEPERDGNEVIALLSQPLTSAIYSPDLDLQGIKLTNPTIRLFATCDDPVEFLSTLDVYTEEVWGVALDIVRQAREEIMADRKGKRRQEVSSGAATERLRMIWGHLKGAPV